MNEMKVQAKKIIYRCTHRGTKELDLILGSFAKKNVPTMDPRTLAAFERFIELPEPILQEILTDKAELPVNLPKELRELLTKFAYRPGSV